MLQEMHLKKQLSMDNVVVDINELQQYGNSN